MIQQLKRDFLICCGGIYDADLVDGKIILRCVRCDQRWQRRANGTFESVPMTKKVLNESVIMGHDFDGSGNGAHSSAVLRSQR
jgi:hypothetical protein